MAHGTSDRLIVTTEEAELRRRGYTLGSTLGEGSYAKVKAALADKENKRVAIKIINQRKAPRDFRERFLPRELDILQSIRHDNLVNMFEIFRMNGKVSIYYHIICQLRNQLHYHISHQITGNPCTWLLSVFLEEAKPLLIYDSSRI